MKLSLLLLLISISTLSLSETMPPLRGQSFADAKVDLPADLHGRVGVLVIGFSKKSSVQTKQWNEALLPDYGNDPHVVYYEAAVLADVPSLFRGTIVKSIRNNMAPPERAHFIPILENASKWRDAAHFASSDEAYVLIIDITGQIQWRAHGPFTGELYGHMKESLAKLQAAK
jgi:hypothetical protein